MLRSKPILQCSCFQSKLRPRDHRRLPTSGLLSRMLQNSLKIQNLKKKPQMQIKTRRGYIDFLSLTGKQWRWLHRTTHDSPDQNSRIIVPWRLILDSWFHRGRVSHHPYLVLPSNSRHRPVPINKETKGWWKCLEIFWFNGFDYSNHSRLPPKRILWKIIKVLIIRTN